MNRTNKGFGVVTLFLLVGILTAMYFVKNENGVSYLEDAYKKLKYYTVDRGVDALEKAKDAKALMQAEQDNLKKLLEE
jgi:hypothetical protein